MALLDIVMDPNEVLRRKAKPVTKLSASVRQLLDDMLETMRAAPGVGLAAPQVGISRRMIVVEYEDQYFQLINPEIARTEGWVRGVEGCLSRPGYVGDVYRYEKVQVVALDRSGTKVWIDAEGWLARIFQHEIDHLDGIMYTDKCTNFRELKPEEVDEEPNAAAEVSAAADADGGTAGAGAGSPRRFRIKAVRAPSSRGE